MKGLQHFYFYKFFAYPCPGLPMNAHAHPCCVQISSLEAVSHLNPDYKRLEKLVLNNNSLVSLAGLETSWVHRTGPSLLDLRNNHIREVSSVSHTVQIFRGKTAAFEF